MTRNIRLVVATTVAVGCAVTGVVALAAPGAGHPASTPALPTTAMHTSGDALDASIARTQQQVRTVPANWPAWATLGLDYVEQARRTVDPTYYPKAAAALRQSL